MPSFVEGCVLLSLDRKWEHRGPLVGTGGSHRRVLVTDD
jgi:hypothetical protein